jgi:hypothetical protein
MTNSPITVDEHAPTASARAASVRERILIVADACFEMFSMKELRNPLGILPELSTEFTDLTREEILEAIRLALSWRRLLRAAGRPVH